MGAGNHVGYLTERGDVAERVALPPGGSYRTTMVLVLGTRRQARQERRPASLLLFLPCPGATASTPIAALGALSWAKPSKIAALFS